LTDIEEELLELLALLVLLALLLLELHRVLVVAVERLQMLLQDRARLHQRVLRERDTAVRPNLHDQLVVIGR
jgi:hypothetical protein